MAASGLGNLLVREGLLTETDRRTIADTAGRGSSAFAKGVLALGLLDEEELATVIANRTRFPLAPRDLRDDQQQGATSILTPQLLQFLEVVPLKVDEQTVTIAMMDPLDRETTHQVEFFAGRRVRPVIATFSQICEGLKRIFPEFSPTNSPLEEFLANHAEAAGRKAGIFGGSFAGAPGFAGEAEESASGGPEDQIDMSSGQSSGAASESDNGPDDEALRAADTISHDAREVELGADPFAKIDNEEPSLPDPTLSAPADDLAVENFEAQEGTESAASEIQDDGTLGDAEPTTEGSGAGSSSGRALAEAGNQEEAALAQELGLDSAETTGDISVIGDPAASTSDSNTLSGVDEATGDSDLLSEAEPSLEMEISEVTSSELSASESVPETAPAEDLQADTPETQDVQEAPQELSSDELTLEEDAPADLPVADVSVEMSAVEAAELHIDLVVAEESFGDEATGEIAIVPDPAIEAGAIATATADLGKPDALDPTVRVSAINRALLAVQMASTNEKAFEAGAKGLGKASCSPGILFGNAKDSGKVIVQWAGAGDSVKSSLAQLGQLDTKDLEGLAAGAPESVISPLGGSQTFLGLQLPAGRGYIVSITGANGSRFIAAFEAEEAFSSASGLHASVVELLRRIAAKLH